MWLLLMVGCFGLSYEAFLDEYVDLRCQREARCLTLQDETLCTSELRQDFPICGSSFPDDLGRSCLASYRGGTCDEVFACVHAAGGTTVCPESEECQELRRTCASAPQDSGDIRQPPDR